MKILINKNINDIDIFTDRGNNTVLRFTEVELRLTPEDKELLIKRLKDSK